MVGTHRIEVRYLSSSGKLSRTFKSIDPPGRIIRFQNDDTYKTGMLMLCDQAAHHMEFKEVLGSKLYTFPQLPNPDSIVTLYALKTGNVYKLITSE